MTLPWKKGNKAKAISKFVADRIQSSKYGGGGGGSSLVVQTGFPTSIVDLFVKNRDRLKKPPQSSDNKIKKKRYAKIFRNASCPDLISTTDSGGDVDVPPTPPLLLVSPPDSRTPTNNFLPPPEDDRSGDEIDSPTFFMAMLKMLLLVVLALATTRFVVGFTTMSAFLLLLLEYVGKHYCRLFKTRHPSLRRRFDNKYSFQRFLERAFCFLGINNNTNNNKSPSFHQQDQDEEEDDFKAALSQLLQEDQGDFKASLSQLLQEDEDHTTHEPLLITRDIEIEVAAPPSSIPPRPPRRIHRVASENDLLEERNEVVLDKEAASYLSCDGLESSNVKKRASRGGRIRSKIRRLMSRKKRNLSAGNIQLTCYSSGEDDNMLVFNTNKSCSVMPGMEGGDCLFSSSTTENGIISFSNEDAATFIALTTREDQEPSFLHQDQDEDDHKGTLGILITRDIGHSHAAPPSSIPPRPPRRIHRVASEPDLLNAQLKWANQQLEEEERNGVVLDKEAAAYASCDGLESSHVKIRASRGGRFKSKIKRLMSIKKKRNQSAAGNKNKASGEDDNMLVFDTNSGMDVVEANRLPGMEGSTNDCLLSSSTTENGSISFSNEISQDDAATSIALTTSEEPEPERPKRKTKVNSAAGYLIFFATVLVGLVAGKSLAIAFTLTFCLLLKSWGLLKGRRPKCVPGDASTS